KEFSSKKIDRFIVRSSAKHETFEERGYYESSKGDILSSNLFDVIKEIWNNNIPYFERYSENTFAVIIQQFIQPKLFGHLSNERRISRNITSWLIEIVNEKKVFQESIKFTSISVKNIPDIIELTCVNKKIAIAKLKILASYYCLKKLRCHVEWVYDGQQIWVVQNDIEDNSSKGLPPNSSWGKSKIIIEQKDLNCFLKVSSSKSDWKKIKCIKTFVKCKLPYGEVYILE